MTAHTTDRTKYTDIVFQEKSGVLTLNHEKLLFRPNTAQTPGAATGSRAWNWSAIKGIQIIVEVSAEAPNEEAAPMRKVKISSYEGKVISFLAPKSCVFDFEKDLRRRLVAPKVPKTIQKPKKAVKRCKSEGGTTATSKTKKAEDVEHKETTVGKGPRKTNPPSESVENKSPRPIILRRTASSNDTRPLVVASRSSRYLKSKSPVRRSEPPGSVSPKAVKLLRSLSIGLQRSNSTVGGNPGMRKKYLQSPTRTPETPTSRSMRRSGSARKIPILRMNSKETSSSAAVIPAIRRTLSLG